MKRLWLWLPALAMGAALLALVWWGWQQMGLAGLQLGMGHC
ncbi:hypothetical protein [Pseudomonas syringae]